MWQGKQAAGCVLCVVTCSLVFLIRNFKLPQFMILGNRFFVKKNLIIFMLEHSLWLSRYCLEYHVSLSCLRGSL